MQREKAQSWADERGMQTLTTAMGSLMDPRVSTCPKNGKSRKAWSKYVHGASAVFAWHIAMEDVVTVLCPPPPQRFHPSGLSYYQTVEEPILRAAIADGASLRIELVHLQVKGAEDFWYELWPVDEVETWTQAFGTTTCRKCIWRMVKGDSPPLAPKRSTQLQPALAKATAKATGHVEIAKAARSGRQLAPAKKSKKKKKKKKNSQKTSPRCETPVSITSASSLATQLKSPPRNALSPVGRKKKGSNAKTAAPLKTSLPKKAKKKAKGKAQKAAVKQGQEAKSKQVQRPTTSRKTQSTKATTEALKTTATPDRGKSKPGTKASRKRKAKKERQALRAAAGKGNNLASSASVVQSKKAPKRSGHSKQEPVQENVRCKT